MLNFMFSFRQDLTFSASKHLIVKSTMKAPEHDLCTSAKLMSEIKAKARIKSTTTTSVVMFLFLTFTHCYAVFNANFQQVNEGCEVITIST